MKRIIQATTAIALSLSLAPRPAVGNPAAVAAPAACASGVGCVVVGSVVVGGVLYYIWRNQQTGQEYRMAADSEMLPDADWPDATEEWEDEIWANNEAAASQKCREMAASWSRSGGRVVQFVRVSRTRDGRFRCVFRG